MSRTQGTRPPSTKAKTYELDVPLLNEFTMFEIEEFEENALVRYNDFIQYEKARNRGEDYDGFFVPFWKAMRVGIWVWNKRKYPELELDWLGTLTMEELTSLIPTPKSGEKEGKKKAPLQQSKGQLSMVSENEESKDFSLQDSLV